ncbi:cell wall-binding repeat-containing protein [Herbiconiux liukaitaii]|uniref:cell wall-binding repeat-containing protein n=1 Tax=Herbiconiux liukaitaii TaxID=3342799 RepID=UPI0035B6B150
MSRARNAQRSLSLIAGLALAAGLLTGTGAGVAAAAETPPPPPTPTASPSPSPAQDAPLVDEAYPLAAASYYSFRADDIISDANMYNGGAMNTEAVQSFLEAEVPGCGNANCLRAYRVSTPTLGADSFCSSYSGRSESAASIISRVGIACGVSQKALLTLIEKESNLVTSSAPTAGRLAAATGYDCRDDGTPCDPATSGFFNQVYNAARQLKSDYLNPRLPIGSPTPVLYNPDTSCGSAPLTIRTKATAALYKYTPYQPNRAALDGGDDGCSSFGNLNFWVIYTDWFGYPHIDVDRIQGADRYEVAASIAREAYPGGTSTLFVATGVGYADALSAGPAAVKLGAPLLLTTPTTLPEAARGVLSDMTNITRIVVVGGPNSVSEGVLAELRFYRPAATVERWGGADRYAVSRTVAARAFGSGTQGVYVATGANFPDALSASGAGGYLGRPVVLVNGAATSVDSATATLLTQTLKATSVTIAGGPNSVTPSLQSSLSGLRTNGSALSVRRLSGADRFSASLAINLDAYDFDSTGVRRERVFVATGLNFPDALAGSALAGAKGSPLVVVQQNCVSQDFKLSLQRFRAERVTLLGGPNSLGSGVQNLTAC